MTSHIDNMGFENYPFISGWVFVEFFLFITGYYTAKHFDGKNDNNSIKSSIIYTYNKFIRFIPYTITVIVSYYVVSGIINIIYNNWSIKNFLFSFSENFIFDILLLTNLYYLPNVDTIWFLSAMFIVFPIFRVLCK